MPATPKRPTEVSHKFKSTDMPEIRRIRSKLLKALKLRAKTCRLEIIVKAIIPDIDWNKLGLDQATIADCPEEIEEIQSANTAITNFREDLNYKLCYGLIEAASQLIEAVKSTASTHEIYVAAYDMADKYHEREKKPTARPRHKKPSTSKNHQRPKPAPKTPAQPTSRPTTPTEIIPPTSPKPSTSTIQSQRLTKPSTKLHKSTPAPTVSHPSISTSQSQRLPKATSNTPTPEMSQPTIRSKFPVLKRPSNTKSTRRQPNSRFSHPIPFNFGWN